MANEFVTMNPYDDQLEKLRQRQRMVDLLQQQALQPLESQVAPGGYAVRTSPVLGLAKMLQAYMGGREQRNINKEMSDIRDKAMQDQRNQEAETASAAAGITGRLFGEKPTQYNAAGLPVTPRPTEAPVAAPQPSGDSLEEITPTAKPMYDPTAALQQAMTSAGTRAMQGNPMLASLLAQTMKPKTLEVGAVDPSKFTPESIRMAQSTGDYSQLKPIAPESTKAPTTVGGMQYDPATKKWNPIPGYTEQAARIAAAGRGPEAPIAIMGPDGKPVYVQRSQAIGKVPYTGTTVAQDIKDAQKEKDRINAGLNTQQTLNTAEQLFNHPGREAGTGASHFLSNVPGTDARDFKDTLDAFKAQTFIPMVSALKGMGALSDAEGKKLTDSVGALDPGMSEEAFTNSLRQITKNLYDKAKANGLDVSLPSFVTSKAGASSGPPIGTVENGYRFKGGNPSDPKNWEKQ